MLDSEILRAIRLEVQRQMNVVLPGVTEGTTDDGKEDIGNMFPGMPTATKRPVVHSYGVVSRAPRNTASVVARMGEHTGNRIVLGHRDKDRPKVQEGESALYNADGELVYLKKGEAQIISKKVKLGSANAANAGVLGDVLSNLLGEVVGAIDGLFSDLSAGPIGIISSPTPGSPVPTFPSLIVSLLAAQAQLAVQKALLLDSDATNILSQKVFLERGP
jgi:hypothetical protein